MDVQLTRIVADSVDVPVRVGCRRSSGRQRQRLFARGAGENLLEAGQSEHRPDRIPVGRYGVAAAEVQLPKFAQLPNRPVDPAAAPVPPAEQLMKEGRVRAHQQVSATTGTGSRRGPGSAPGSPRSSDSAIGSPGTTEMPRTSG